MSERAALVQDTMASAEGVKSKEHSFWDHAAVPGEDSSHFGPLISRHCRMEAGQIFRPKDEHSGIWHSPPNIACHASFGDQGTTASVNCYGDLIQLSQYLGAGHSGVFSLDQWTTEEPYLVQARADQLESFSKDAHNASLIQGLILARDFWPSDPLEVKWVNWRWPRYEYSTKTPGLDAVIQWVVDNGIVLQQLVLENTGDKSVDIHYNLDTDMLIRDLDYLDPSFSFNDNTEGYTHVSGPNGYGHVCVHEFKSPVPNERSDGQSPQESKGREEEYVRKVEPLSRSQPRRPEPDKTVNTDKTQTDDARSGAAVGAQSDNAAVENGANRAQNDTPLTREPHSVAAVTTLFVDGKAVKMHDDSGFSSHCIIDGHSVVEFVVAYKLILLPTLEVHWENFLVTAEEADVSKFLRDESHKLWGSAEDITCCSLSLSMIDPEDTLEKTAGRCGANCKDSGGSDRVKSKPSDDMTKPDSKKAEGSMNGENDDMGPSLGLKGSDPNHNPGAKSSFTQGKIGSPSGPPGMLSPKSHIEYLAWRHLEHILSVCAVPLTIPSLKTGDGQCPKTADSTLVALTCGDMAGHRISTSASFFAFRFLIDVARRLEYSGSKSPYIFSLQHRIRAVCQGHMKWLEELLMVDGRLLKSGCFAANYWVTGKIMPESSDTWQPRDAITDTPFQILKMADYHGLCAKEGGKGRLEDDKRIVLRLWEKVRVSWLQELNNLDKRASFAWPHARDEGINTFRLDDHFWVWKALKELEDLGLWSTQPSLKSVQDDKNDSITAETKEEELARIARRLLPGDVQRGVLQRFTTENDVSRKRMLAVTRSARESRFLLHARDTALFHGYDCGFFLPDSSFQELWENTIEAQPYHDENKETGWGNAIRYALGIVVGTREFCLNQQSPAGLVKSCVEVLIRSGGHNGFFPGQLDEATKKPTIFYDEEDRDFYHHANFEINHILLTHARRIDTVFQETTTFPQKQPRLTDKERPRPSNEDEFLSQLFSELAEMLVGLMAQPKRQKVVSNSPEGDHKANSRLKRREITPRLDGRRSLTMKKVIPFNNLIDASRITSFEEEWLYDYPAFLSTEEVSLVEQINLLRKPDQPGSDLMGGIIAQKFQEFRSSNREFSLLGATLYDAEIYIADTPKQKHLGRRDKRRFDVNPFTRLDILKLDSELGAARTADNAKKRFIWLPCAKAEIALLCWMASPETEKPALSLFFDRHSKNENHVSDDTTMVLNTWQTELHLSFYVLVDTSAATSQRRGLPLDSRDSFPGSSRKDIWRASIGFRFDGDIFDRYWTCHFIEHIPRSDPSYSPYEDRVPPFRSSDRHTDKQWRQRKVLELHLLDRILITILESSREILDQVREELGVDITLSSSVLNSDIYLSSKDDSQKFEQLLQVLDDDIISILHTLQKWRTREKDRGEEKPRWTRNDERKYRGAINKLQGSTERHIRDLEIRRDNVRKLKETLTTRREKARQDLEFHWNENIRYFTYVTVIFLPLGFASSFYSMGGPPEHDLIISLVEFAVAAFAVTVILLLNAKWILSAFRTLAASRLFSAAKRLPALVLRRATKRSLLVGEHQKRKPGDHEPGKEQKSGSPKPGQKIKHQEDLHGALFWLSYIFVEIPARRVLRAAFAMRRGQLSGPAAVNIILGVIFVPIFGTLWLLRVMWYNMLDLMRKISGWLGPVFMLTNLGSLLSMAGEDEKEEELFMRHFNNMTDLPQSFRPLKSRRKVEEEKEHH